jgi:hypothetical protein
VCKLFSLNTLLCAALITVLGVVSGFAQDLCAEGDRFIAAGLPDEAVTSYLRALYENRETSQKSDLFSRIARCQMELGDDDRAVRYARLSVTATPTEPERVLRRLELAEILLAAGRYAQAGSELEALEVAGCSGAARLRLKFLAGILAVYRHDWEKAWIHLSLYFAETQDYAAAAQERVLNLVSFGRQARRVDPEAARTLSFVLPGSGQMYSGEFFPGLNSLLVAGGAGALVAVAIAAGDWPDAVAIAWFVFLRFYLGSPYHADRIAREKNQGRSETIERTVLELLAE